MEDLKNKLQFNQKLIGKKYYHYKSKNSVYQIILISINENNLKILITYTDGNLIWTRTYYDFFAIIQYENNFINRFTEI